MTLAPALSVGPASLPAGLESYGNNAEAICHRVGWKVTDARRAILQAIDALPGYFDADSLHAEARKTYPISRATVYRALPDLHKFNLLHSTEFGDGHHQYCRRDPASPPTAEIYVVDCGRILEVPAPFLGWYAAAVTEKAGYQLIGHRLQTFARCDHHGQPNACAQCELKSASSGVARKSQ